MRDAIFRNTEDNIALLRGLNYFFVSLKMFQESRDGMQKVLHCGGHGRYRVLSIAGTLNSAKVLVENHIKSRTSDDDDDAWSPAMTIILMEVPCLSCGHELETSCYKRCSLMGLGS